MVWSVECFGRSCPNVSPTPFCNVAKIWVFTTLCNSSIAKHLISGHYEKLSNSSLYLSVALMSERKKCLIGAGVRQFKRR